MNNYDLSELVQNVDDVQLEKIVERLSSQREYRKIIRKMLRETGGEIDRDLLVKYLEQHEGEAEYSTEVLLAAVLLVLAASTNRAIEAVRGLIGREVDYLDAKFIEAVSKRVDIDITALVRPEDRKELLEQIVKRNASYIQNVSDQTKLKIEQAVIDAQLKNKPVSELKKDLRKILGDQAKRADRIADDQMEKLAANVIDFRAKQANLREYIWMSQGDSRVRHAHRQLHGTTQNADDPNGGDNGMLPREPMGCRCWAVYMIKGKKK